MNLSLIKNTRFIRNPYLAIRYGIFKAPFLSKKIEVDMGDNVSFKLDYSFGPCKYEKFGDRHNCGFRKWIECCRGKSIVFDVGAHIGLYSIPVSKVINKNGSIYAFEPSEANRYYLERHISYNRCDNINIKPFLVGEKTSDKVEFHENKAADPMNSFSPVKNLQNYRKVLRQQVSLDDFCQREKVSPEIIKIDVEGAEARVLRGAQKILRDNKPLVFLSIHPERMKLMGDTMEDFRRIVSAIGYSVYDIKGGPAQNLSFGEYILR